MMVTGYSAAAEIQQQQKLSQQIARTQSEISSGKRISVASDDPIAAARISQIRLAQADQTAWTRNVASAQAIASQVDTTLTGIAAVFNRVKELALAGASQSSSATDRQAMVQELNDLNLTLSNYQTATTPTGQNLFPTDAPLFIPVSATDRVSATAKQSDVFEGIPVTAGNTASLSDIIRSTASSIATADPTQRAALMSASLTNIDAASTHIVAQQSAQGLRAARLDSASEALVNSGEQLIEERSSLEDTDVASAVMQLNAKTLSLQAAQAAFARVNRNTLFDFLS